MRKKVESGCFFTVGWNEMDDADPELGSDPGRTGDHVPGQDPRIGKKQLTCRNQKRPEFPGVLDMPADF